MHPSPPVVAPPVVDPTHRRRARLPAALATLLIAGAALTAAAAAAPAGDAPRECGLFPDNSYWYADITALPRQRGSDRIIDSIGRDAPVHADFGSGRWDGGPIGIPYDVVAGDQRRSRVRFRYASESDGRRYPIPDDVSIEGGPSADGDRHVLLWQQERCRLWELFDARRGRDGRWHAGSGAVWDLASTDLRPDGWTSADAAGLPILPGLVRYDEVAAGSIDHAIRITVPRTRARAVWPARHVASSDGSRRLPPMGTWLRLDPSIDPNDFPPQAAVVVRALQEHGAIVADNGSAWYLSGAPDRRWDNDDLHELGRLTGADFTVVRSQRMRIDHDSAAVRARFHPD